MPHYYKTIIKKVFLPTKVKLARKNASREKILIKAFIKDAII